MLIIDRELRELDEKNELGRDELTVPARFGDGLVTVSRFNGLADWRFGGLITGRNSRFHGLEKS